MAWTSSLSAFLATARKALTAAPAQRQLPLTIVVGNESADLDSLCSALVLAYLRTSTPPHALHIPLANLPRADLALRPELTAVLSRAGLRASDLLTLDDLPGPDGPDGLHPEHTRWLLVDHNALTGPLLARRFDSRVIGCVDHHEDEGKVTFDVKDAGSAVAPPRVIEKCGSCMSLVVRECRRAWEALAPAQAQTDQKENAVVAQQLAHLALGPILIDTVNLTSPDKTTELDVQAATFAESFLLGPATATAAAAATDSSTKTTTYDRAAYFDDITRLKEDLSSMSFRDVLRKDYKRWTAGRLSLGVSMSVRGLEFLTSEIGSREEFLAALRRWAEEQELDIAVVMAISKPEGRFTRQLLVWALNPDAVRAAKRFFAENGGELALETWGQGELDDVGSGEAEATWRMVWKQGNTACSRKQVAPMLRDAMEKTQA